ncbi:hypothetical protein ACJX0J_014403, partial [Zea mays]
ATFFHFWSFPFVIAVGPFSLFVGRGHVIIGKTHHNIIRYKFNSIVCILPGAKGILDEEHKGCIVDTLKRFFNHNRYYNFTVYFYCIFALYILLSGILAILQVHLVRVRLEIENGAKLVQYLLRVGR